MNFYKKLKQNIQKDRETLRQLTFRQKIRFIRDYYKGQAFILICLCLLAFYVGDAWVTAHRETVLEGFITNDEENLFPAKELARDFTDYLELSSDQQVLFDDSLFVRIGSGGDYETSSQSKIVAYVSARELDLLITTKELTEYYTPNFPLYDLEKLLPEDLKERLQDDFYYAEDGSKEYKACAVSMEHSRFAEDAAADGTEPHYLMAFSYTQHPEVLVQFLEYAFE